MAIIQNTFNTTDTQFYSSHSPFTIPAGTSATSDLKNMVIINYIVPPRPIKVNQIFGAETFLNFTVFIRNVTVNVPLQVEISHSKFFNISTNKNINLSPRDTINIDVTGDNLYINSQGQSFISTNFSILVKNLSNDIAYISPELAATSRIAFPEQITIQ